MVEQADDMAGRVVERQMRLLDVEDPPPPQMLGAARAAAWLAGWHRALMHLGEVEWEGAEEWAEAYAEGYEAGQVLIAVGGDRPRTGEDGRGAGCGVRGAGTATASRSGDPSHNDTATAEWEPPRGWREHDNG